MQTSVAVVASVLGSLVAAIPGHAETVYADTYLMVGRYSTYRTAPDFDQLNPLAQIITVKLPEARVRTVGQALQQLLRGSGYAQIHSPDPYAAALLDKPLPEVHRQLGPMPLAAALKTLVGQPYEILVNDVQRQVCVELKKAADPNAMTTLVEALKIGTTESSSPKPAATSQSARRVTVNLKGSEGYVRR